MKQNNNKAINKVTNAIQIKQYITLFWCTLPPAFHVQWAGHQVLLRSPSVRGTALGFFASEHSSTHNLVHTQSKKQKRQNEHALT